MMDSSEKIEAVPDKRNGDQSSFYPPSVPSEWRFSGDHPNPSFNLVPTDVCRGVSLESSSSPSVSVVDSFCPSIWDSHNLISQHLGFKRTDSHSNDESNISGVREMISASRVGWNGSASLSKSSNPFQGILPQSLVQFPADSGFIERAARFSCFSGMMNPFPLSEPMPSFSKVGGTTPTAQKNDMGISETCKDGFVAPDEGDPTKKVDQKMANLLKSTGSSEEGKQRVGSPSIESDGAEISACRKEEPSHLDSAVKEPSPKGHSSKKRKRIPQGTEQNQANSFSQLKMDTGNENRENKPKVEPNQIIVAGKPNGKQPEDNAQVPDTQKEDYIHVRARRGQATNSHSLAERVRREKISERMKFLQELVPGCSKVTGKAVMLDEIINYVQSLQRQVEFLSMKLATVNPQLDFSMDNLLLKDTFHSRGVLSSAVGYVPDMNMIQSHLQPSRQGLVQTGTPGIPTPSDSFRRAFNSYLTSTSGYKESSQIPNVWEDELNSVVQMSFGTGMPFNNNQEQSGQLPPGHMKTEL